MADQYSNEGSRTGNVSGESSDLTVQLNIKTLDSQVYSFQVDKNMRVSLFKEKIANETGVPVGQQRLIFRGRVLKDDHLLLDYHVENGHTLHLVERQPSQAQPSSGAGSGEAAGSNGSRGSDPSTGNPRNRIGQISHSVVLGTFNVGEQAEGVVPDLSRVIGAVLNSIGLGGQTTTVGTSGTQSSTLPNDAGQAPRGNETEGIRGNVGIQIQAGNQAQSGQAFSGHPFQSLPQVVQIPLATAAAPVPSLHVPIPDSLSTLSEFMNHMEQTFLQNGYQPNPSSTNAGDPPRVELPSNAQGLRTPEALSIVLRHGQRLLGGQAAAALSHIAVRLEQEGSSSDTTIRAQLQAESIQLGLAMQHLGAWLLELGRTILTLRMGQSPAESVLNAGPAVYISSSGPNPIMVQPFPHQTSSFFGGSVPQSNPGPVGIGITPRHINIHIHAGTSLAPIVSAVGTRAGSAEVMQGERQNGAGSGDSSATRVLPTRSVNPVVGASHPSGLAGSGFDSVSLSSVTVILFLFFLFLLLESCADLLINQLDQLSNINALTGLKDVSASSGTSLSCLSGGTEAKSDFPQETTLRSDQKHDTTEGAKAVPLGLGLGGLERKRRGMQQKSKVMGGDRGTTSTSDDQNQQIRKSGQQILQSLASRSSVVNNMNANERSPEQLPSPIDMAGLMSQVMQTPSLNGLLTSVSEQAGVGSPDFLRNVLQQLSLSPQMRNTVSQVVQQVDSQDLGSMFAGLGRGQGGGLDLPRMFQQMMPVVSQVLRGGSTHSQFFPAMEAEAQPHYNEPRMGNDDKQNEQNFQTNLQQVAQRIERLNPPGNVFHSVVENAAQLSGRSGSEDLINELCSDEGLANEYMEMLHRDVHQRLHGESRPDNCSP
ncbi:ubiquitin-like domain-containing protein CIP73 [Juglans microcarpa x Juglans regia]|uniref:ubiquitin-like domain-containing protein CIP73 n=1 Tax=Juglans microcarpa x Juglans regia TaxID=2249226 RepID=UPI001B7E65B2|nr:ubiquitin-like domain-containing protein CIP73 [Juglans microcarpa x Juglans regia]